MNNKEQLQARARELDTEVRKARKAFDEGRLEAKRFNGIVEKAFEESETIRNTLENLRQGLRLNAANEKAFGGGNSLPDEFGVSDGFMPPGFIPGPGVTPLGFNAGPSPADASPVQMKAIAQAARAGTPMAIECTRKGGFKDGIVFKSPVLESGITGSPFAGNLPPVQTPFAVGLPYEPSRVSSWLPGMAMSGPSATWQQHVSNTNEVTGVAEGATKPDLGPTFAEHQVLPQKLAAVTSFSLELWQDTSGANYGEAAITAFLYQELTRSYINSESLYLLQATTSGTNPISGGPINAAFNGLLNTSGTLTRALGSDTVLDCLQKAYVDLRASSGAFANPDLLIVHPATMGAIRRSKDAEGRYLMSLIDGPLSFTATGAPPTNTPPDSFSKYSVVPQDGGTSYGSIWGVPILETTQCPAGTAVMLSIRAGAAVFWTRLGLRLEFNPGFTDSMWSTNTYGYRVDARIALSTPRPGAINVISGLPTS